MNGKEIVKIVDAKLEEKGMTQKEFCALIGVQSSAMSAWRKGSMPNPQRIAAIERVLEINLDDYEKADTHEKLRDVDRILLDSVADLPPSSVFALIAQVEKMKEDKA